MSETDDEFDPTAFRSRLFGRMEELRLSDMRASKEAGLSGDAIRNLRRKPQSRPDLRTLEQLARRLGVNPLWLVHGEAQASKFEGVPRRAPQLVSSFDPDAPDDSSPVEGQADPNMPPDAVRELAARGGMGTGEVVHVIEQGEMRSVDAMKVEYWRFPPSFLRNQLQATPQDLMVIECMGDSMSPTLEPGDRVIVDTATKLPKSDGLYALRNEWESIVVKRLSTIPGRPIRLRISSDNPNHQSYEVDPADVTIIGKVVTGLRMF